jgi:probable HAF family extracellular repeat protein
MKTHTFRSLLSMASVVALVLASGWASAQQLYRLTDLGTLGGPTSWATAMNDSGQVTGSSSPSIVAVWHAFVSTGTTMKDLGRLDEHVSDGWDINDSGQVVGDADLDKDLDADRVFMWNGSTRKNLGRGTGTGINASGQVTGSAKFSGNVNPHPFLWDGSTMRDLGTLGGTSGQASAINVAGQVTGWAATAGNVSSHAFLWSGSTMQDLGTLGGTYSAGNAINDSGQVTGDSLLAGDSTTHAFLWDGSTMRDLGTLDGSGSSIGYAINASGQVTGSASLAGSQGHAFLWDGSAMRDLGTLGTIGVGTAINASGQVTGYSRLSGDESPRAFLSNGGPMVDLNDIIDPQDPLKRQVVLRQGVDINARGQIAANGYDSHIQQGHAYLVTPLEYRILYIAPVAGSKWKEGTTVPVKIALVDVKGKRISDSRAASLVATQCKVKFSSSGAQTKSAVCMKYNAATNEFYVDWKLGATGAGSTALKVAATYKFNMPETITSKKWRTISIIR